MPTPPLSTPHMPSHNAAVVIRERIKEKRLFEAQFLFGLLDEDDIPAQERLNLERELDGLLAVVRDLQLQANKYLAEGEHNLARKMHREMERIAIDVPGLEFGKRHIEEQDNGSKEPAIPHDMTGVGQSESLAGETEAAKPKELRGHLFLLQAQQRLTRMKGQLASIPKGKIVLASSLLVLLLIGFLFLNLMRQEYSDASLKAKAEDAVAIKPLSVRPGESSAVHTQGPEQVKQTPAGTESPASNIIINPLSVESGSAQ